MKKNKFLLGALGLFTLASCSNDDLQGLGDAYRDFSDKVVLRVNVQPENDDAITRAFKDTDGYHFTWVEGDKLRAYDELLQVYDEFAVEDNTFAIPKDGAKVEDLKYGLVLFADEKNISFAGWNGGKNLALVKIDDEFKYEEQESSDGTVIYKSTTPMYGFPNKVEETENGMYVDVNLQRLTGQAKVVFENGEASKATAVRASSYKFTNEEDNTDEKLQEYLGETVITKNTPDAFAYGKKGNDKCKVEPNTDAPLSGWFQAELDKTTAANNKLQQITDKTGAINKANGTTIVVNISAGAMEKYNNIVYIPLVSQKYEILLLEYTEDDLSTKSADEVTWKFLRIMQNYTPSTTGTMGSMNVTTPMERKITKLSDIQEAIDDAAAIGKDAVVKLNILNSIQIQFSATEADYTLTIPNTLNGHKITLDCTGPTGNEAITTGDRDYDIFKIKAEEGAEGTLVIEGAAVLAATEAELGKVKLELNGGKYGAQGKKMKFVTEALKLGDVKFDSELELTAADLYIDGEVEMQSNAKLSASGSVVVTENGEISAEISAANVTVDGKAAKITAEEKVTVNSGAEVSGTIVAGSADIFANLGDNAALSATGNVAIAKGVTVNSLTLGNAEGDAIANINITVAEEPAAAAEEAAKANPVVTALTVNKVTKVNATDITIAGITKTAEIGNTEIHTAGASEITSVLTSTENLKFTSEYDGSVAPSSLPGTAANGYRIYTAAQLMKVTTAGSASTTYYLNTDITSKANVEWTALRIGNTSTNYNKPYTFDGGSHIIDGVNLVGTDKVGVFSEIVSNNTTSAVTVKDLTIKNVKYAGTADVAVTNVGALAGKVSGTGPVNIKNVTVSGSSLGTDVKESYNIGGLIGQVDGATVNLTGSTLKLTGNIAGHYNLGGTIGSVKGGANVTVKTSPIVIGGFAVYDNKDLDADDLTGKEEEHAKYGTVGMVVGSILGYTNTLTLGTEGNVAGDDLFSGNKRSTDVQRKALHFDYNFKYNSSNGKKQWFKGGLSAIGYSPTMVEIDETTGLETENASTVTYLGNDYKASSINSYTTTAY